VVRQFCLSTGFVTTFVAINVQLFDYLYLLFDHMFYILNVYYRQYPWIYALQIYLELLSWFVSNSLLIAAMYIRIRMQSLSSSITLWHWNKYEYVIWKKRLIISIFRNIEQMPEHIVTVYESCWKLLLFYNSRYFSAPFPRGTFLGSMFYT